jgi:hypothetical protein
MSFKSNWYRFFGTAVVALCAMYTTWHQTHPPSKVKMVTQKVIEGDGRMTEEQCRKVDIGTERKDMRKRFGFPNSEANDDTFWHYPIRGKDGLYCNFGFGYYDSLNPFGSGEDRVIHIWLDIRKG